MPERESTDEGHAQIPHPEERRSRETPLPPWSSEQLFGNNVSSIPFISESGTGP